jgi:hypothetical protein
MQPIQYAPSDALHLVEHQNFQKETQKNLIWFDVVNLVVQVAVPTLMLGNIS